MGGRKWTWGSESAANFGVGRVRPVLDIRKYSLRSVLPPALNFLRPALPKRGGKGGSVHFLRSARNGEGGKERRPVAEKYGWLNFYRYLGIRSRGYNRYG